MLADRHHNNRHFGCTCVFVCLCVRQRIIFEGPFTHLTRPRKHSRILHAHKQHARTNTEINLRARAPSYQCETISKKSHVGSTPPLLPPTPIQNSMEYGGIVNVAGVPSRARKTGCRGCAHWYSSYI